MRIVRASIRTQTMSLDGRGAARGRTSRESLILELATETGVVGLGEAAPLPGMSRDTFDDARAALAAFADGIGAGTHGHAGPACSTESALGITIGGIGDVFAVAVAASSPAARFAIETALLDALSQTRNVGIVDLLREHAGSRGACDLVISTAVVIDEEQSARIAVANGARCLKIKVGADGELDRVRAIANVAIGALAEADRPATAGDIDPVKPDRAGLTLRLDANGTWPREAVHARLAAIADLPIEFIEEPCASSHTLLPLPPTPVRIALDESLVELPEAALANALRSPSLAALVLKPTLLGGFAACLDLAARARAAGVPAIVTHALEGPIGFGACVELARAIGGPHAHGVAPHAGLVGPEHGASEIPIGESDRTYDVRTPYVRPQPIKAGADSVRTTYVRGVDQAGQDPSSYVRRTYNVRTPHSDHTHLGAGLANDTSNVRFEHQARHNVDAIHTTVAAPTQRTVETVHAALAKRRPLALLHHALPVAEIDRRRRLVEQAELGDAAFVLFTSGSTGDARGVVLSRAAIEAAAAASAAHLGWRDDDRWLIALSMAHAGGLAAVTRCWLAGKPIALLGDWDRARAAELLDDCTLASLVPAQLADLLADPAWRPHTRLRAVLLGGAAASPMLRAEAAARGVPFLTTYGMTESFGQLATATLDRAGDPGAPLVPLAGVELVAGTRDAPAPIQVRAPMLAERYLDGAAISPRFTTADLGFLEAGALHVVGRTDEVIVTGGENVHPATIEAVLAATPGVRAACVFAVADERWGQIVGAAVAAERVDDAALASWHVALPAHARPRELAVVGSLPMLATGKLDRRAASRLPRSPVRYR